MQKIEEKNLLDELVNSGASVLVDFSASWCGPCKVLIPQLEAAEKQINEDPNFSNIKFLKADIDNDGLMDILSNLSIKSVPTVIMFKDGRVADRFVGVKSKDQIISFIKGSLSVLN